jgi:endonuclease-3
MINQKKAVRQLNALKRAGKQLRLAAEWRRPWQSLISTILSARTRDEKTIEVSNALYRKYKSVRALAEADLRDVGRIIRGVNYYRTKAKNIIACAGKIAREHGGAVPRDFDKLVELPGVGRKTANVFLAHQGGAHIGVDTHLGYVSRKMGWTKHDKPHLVEEDLKKLFPRRYWRKLNYIVVRFGQTYRSRRKKDKMIRKIRQIG